MNPPGAAARRPANGSRPATVGHCPGCVCAHLRGDVIMVPVARELLHTMGGAWSEPVQIQIMPDTDGGHVMWCRTSPPRPLEER